MLEGDRLLDLVGIGLVAIILLGAGMVVLAGLDAGGDAPDADWTFQRINDTHVQVGHTGGESVRADRLTITVDGTERSHGWEGEVTKGDVAVVRAKRNATVRLYWTTPAGGRELLEAWGTQNTTGTAER